MAQNEKVDVVTVGAGLVAGIMAYQLTQAGLRVVSLEQGPWLTTEEDFSHDHDELRYNQRREMMVDLSRETWTWRPSPKDRALPMRQYGSFNPHQGVGGAAVHWAAQNWRFYPSDFEYRSHHIERYGEEKLPVGNRIRDWGINWDDIEPYYDRWEYDSGVSGTAGNIMGEQIEGGNIFEGPRAREYPLPSLTKSIVADKFTAAANELGYHPFPQPSGIISEAYPDLAGNMRGACLYCGFCTRYGCEVAAKSNSLVVHMPAALDTGLYEIRPDSYVFRINTDSAGNATGVSYIDSAGREQVQEADIVLVSAYMLTNVRLLLMSRSNAHQDGIGNDWGLVGTNYTYQLGGGGSNGLFAGERLNQFMGNGAMGALIHDFNADNFDHSDLDFIGGGSISSGGGERNPVGSVGGVRTESGTNWGAEWKEALRENWDSYAGVGIQGESLPYDDQFVDLDPTYRDRFGFPLLRITFDWHENDYNLIRYLSPKMREILERMGATNIQTQEELTPYRIGPYQSTHCTGGAIMGTDPGNSVVNRYGQVWDTPNVFVVGASQFPQNAGMNPTGTVAALAYMAGDGIVNEYVNAPGEIIGTA
ncbi:MAG: choline dehydrogenase-like flavoprotein [Thermomicrobiales bacterium]|nr:choline dehydrogenase-like flavoprotein [Thermomicrobiales bacterium]